MSHALVMPCSAPRARLYSGRLVHPGTPHAQAVTGVAIVVTKKRTTAVILSGKANTPLDWFEVTDDIEPLRVSTQVPLYWIRGSTKKSTILPNHLGDRGDAGPHPCARPTTTERVRTGCGPLVASTRLRPTHSGPPDRANQNRSPQLPQRPHHRHESPAAHWREQRHRRDEHYQDRSRVAPPLRRSRRLPSGRDRSLIGREEHREPVQAQWWGGETLSRSLPGPSSEQASGPRPKRPPPTFR